MKCNEIRSDHRQRQVTAILSKYSTVLDGNSVRMAVLAGNQL
jgi:hypothetical protein